MRLEKCYFCSSTVYPGHGITFVRNDSKIFKFCRSKCHKAFKRKKNPRKTRWTKAYRKSTGKELTEDPALEFEKKRHVPEKYSRELWAKTVDGMKKSADIKESREGLHVKNRLKQGKIVRTRADAVNVKKNIALIKSPAPGILRKTGLKGKVRVEEDIMEKKEADANSSESETEEQPLMETN